MSCSEKDSEFEDLNDLINDIGNDDQILDNIITKPKKIIKVNFPENSKILDEVLFGNKKNFAEKLQQEDLIFDDISEREKNFQAPTSVWHDSDDDDVEKSLELKSKRKFERITSVTPSWASFNKKKKQKAEDSDEDIEISQNVGHLSTEHNEDVAISKNSLKFKRLANMNKITKREGKISVVDFHPRSTVGIVAGIHGMVSLFAIDGEENKKIYNIKYEKYPIYSCKLLGDELIVGSKVPYYHSYNLITGCKQRPYLPTGIKHMKSFELSACGKLMAVVGESGEIHLVHAPTKELFTTLKQEHQCTSLVFSQDSKRLFAHSDDNEVTIFDMRTHRIEHRFVDDGCVNGTTVTISGNSKYLATGSRQGYVNLYKYEDVLSVNRFPQPIKAFDNLKTEITDIKFNPSNEILGFCSVDVNNSIKFLHVQSTSVFDNFPSQFDTIGKITTLAFSPGGGYVGVGNISGEVPLYRLKHYNNY